MRVLADKGQPLATNTDLAKFDPGTDIIPSLPPDQHPVRVYLASLSVGSRRTMAQALGVIAEIITGGRMDALALPWNRVEYQHCQAVRSLLAERYKASTANKMLAAMRGVLREAWRLGHMDAETYHRAVDIKSIKGESLPKGRMLSVGEIRALVESCDPTATGKRDAALLAVLYCGGLRRSEAVALDVGDFDSVTGELRVSGKGNKERIVYATNGAADAITAWVSVRGSSPGPLFLPTRKGGKVLLERRLTAQSVLDILRKLAKRANVAQFSPHDLRRTFISALLDAGVDLVTVQKMAAHAQVTTTARYDRRDEKAKKQAAEMLHFPFAA